MMIETMATLGIRPDTPGGHALRRCALCAALLERMGKGWTAGALVSAYAEIYGQDPAQVGAELRRALGGLDLVEAIRRILEGGTA